MPGMTFPACPITVKKALNKVDGVSKVEIRYEKKQAVVTFDDTKADTKALTRATPTLDFLPKSRSNGVKMQEFQI